MTKTSTEEASPVGLPLLPVAGFYELLVWYLRQQDSDLRMLQVIENAAEGAEQRVERLTNELLGIHPHLPRASVTGYVRETLALVNDSIAEGGPVEDRLEKGYMLAERLAKELTPVVDAVHFAGHLMRACIDDPDSVRMRGTLLLSAMASFEGYLVAAARLLGMTNPEPLLRPIASAPSALNAEPVDYDPKVADEVERKVDKLSRGGWQNWERLFEGRFGIDFPDRPASLRDAFVLRNAVAHANGSPSYGGSQEDGSQLSDAVRLEHASELTAEYLEALQDALLLFATRMMFNALRRFGNSGREASGNLLANVRFELLLRKRFSAAAMTGDLDRVVYFADEQHRRSTQINRWLALKSLDRQGEYMRELDSWGESVNGTVHEVARAVLRGRPNEAARLTARLRAAGKVSNREWHSWPLFESIREPHPS